MNLCQAHVERVPAVKFYMHRWRCQPCLDAIKSSNGRANHRKPAALGAAIVSAPTITPVPYTPPNFTPLHKGKYLQYMAEAVDRSLAYSWRSKPSLYP